MKFSTKNLKSTYTTLLKKIKSNKPRSYLLVLLVAIPVLTVLIAFLKLTFSETNYIYAKIKVSQGLWWSSTKRPDYWFVENLNEGIQEKGIAGKISTELLGFTYYPFITENNLATSETTYNIYLDVSLDVKKTRSGELIFKRNKIAVGSPIELSFPNLHITGAVIQLSEKPLVNEYITKTIQLTGRNIFPWEYDAIKIGDTYFDGKQEVFKVLDKKSIGTTVIAPDLYGNFPSSGLERRRYVTVTAQVKLKKAKGEKLFFGEEQEITIGTPFSLVTPNSNYSFLTISKLE